jgi:hypothetical protein
MTQQLAIAPTDAATVAAVLRPAALQEINRRSAAGPSKRPKLAHRVVFIHDQETLVSALLPSFSAQRAIHQRGRQSLCRW